MKLQYYRSGQDRNEPKATIHTYAETDEGIFPMCGYGWNRSNGNALSIFRGSPGTRGDCKLCKKNIEAGKAPVMNGFPHKTKWL